MRYFTVILFFISSCVEYINAQVVENLGSAVNSIYEEREPILSPDGKTLFFWRRLSPENTNGVPDPGDIWYSNILPNKTLTAATRMNAPLNSKGHDFVWKVSDKKDTLWLHQTANSNTSDGLAFAIKNRDGSWSIPQQASIKNFNYTGRYKDFFLTPDGFMLIPNGGEGTFGGTDIYICFPVNTTTWSKPINLGPVINSSGDEDAPFLSSDGKTLFFSSNGHGGYGDHDIFKSTRLDDSWQRWSKPVNLGRPVNTEGYDFDFILSPDEKYAYWGSDREGLGKSDLYRMPLDKCEVAVYPKGDQAYCEGEQVIIEAGFSLAEDTMVFEWFRDGTRLKGENERTLLVSEPGNYYVKQFKDGCSNRSETKQIRFIRGPEASFTSSGSTLCDDDSLMLRGVMSQLGLTFEWIRNGLDIPNAKEQSYYVQRPGKYQVKVSNEVCFSVSEPIDIQRLNVPSIYFARDTLANSRLRVPKWDWNNRLSKQRIEAIPEGVAVGESEHLYAVSLVPRRKGLWRERITRLFPGGPVRWDIEGEDVNPSTERHMCVDPEGNLIITRDEKYLAKYNESGQLEWELPQRRDKVSGVTTDPAGYIYAFGRFKDTLYVGNTDYPGVKRGNMYIVKHHPNGEVVWVRIFSADWEDGDFGNAIHTDEEGNIYVSGAFSSIANFREQTLRSLLKSNSYFVAKYNSQGKLQWARKIVTDRVDYETSDMHTDKDGNTFLLINYKLFFLDKHGDILREKILKAPGGPEQVRIASYNQELFISGYSQERGEYFTTKWDRNGEQVLLWRSREAVANEKQGVGIDVGPSGDIFITGNAKKSLPPGTVFSSNDASAVFVARYGKPKPEKRLRPISLCESESGSLELFAKADDNVSFRWLKDGQEIPGENLSSLSVSQAGSYQVKILDANCEAFSAIQKVAECEDKVFEEQVSPTSQVVTKPAVTIPEGEQDLERRPDGQPRRLKGRRTKSQGELTVSNPYVVISVFDHAAFDGDTISLNVNGKWVLSEYGLKKKQKDIPITLNKTGPNFIILYAHNLGSTPPNTASIIVHDGNKPQVFKLRSNLNTCGTLDIRLE